jgi:peptidoglycan-associated lipoprotein
MKQSPVVGKALATVFAFLFIIGCSSTPEETDGTSGSETAGGSTATSSGSEMTSAEQAAREAQDKVNTMGNVVYFDFDQSTLSRDTRRVLDAHIALAKSNSGSIRLEGHADERGTREYNMALGERRAKAVADYMVVNGVATHRIETVSYGEERPVAYGSGEANWSQNRRVEIK